ncbi:MAG TPA: acetyl-CoA carboxylase biotin carboxyl carrier protein [Xanthobacteraceae bacterium]|nr:acetyl-CoA carboxylase biotin carboxyl carrier protein [Xanthobacteraceae bacterium]
MTLRYEEIAEILKIIDSSNCDEVSIETGDIKLFVRRTGAVEATRPPSGPESARPAAASEIKTRSPSPAGTIAVAAGQFEITAPMVGTFYRAPSPETPPFVEIGSVVKKGQPLCLIEVMKLFTTVYAEQDGRVVHIGAENGELVEYGRTLFVFEPAMEQPA